MRIIRVRAKDYCCHEELDIELREGINAVLGPNGSGKSTILDIIRFGLLGDSANEGTKADNVRWGAATARTVINFEHGGTEYELTRTLGKRNSQTLVYVDTTLTRADEIVELLEDICGTTVNALTNNVFVPQGRIDNILYLTNSHRLKEIQQTVGLGRAAEAAKSLQAETSRYQVNLALDHQVELAEESLESAAADLIEKGQARAAQEREVEAARPYQELLDRYQEAQRTSVAIQQADDRANRVASRMELAVTRLEEATADRDRLRELAAAQVGVATDARVQLAQHDADKLAAQAAEELREQLAETTRALNALKKPPEVDLAKSEVFIDKLKDKLSLRRRQLTGELARPLSDEESQTAAEIEGLTSKLKDLGSSRTVEEDEWLLARSLDEAVERAQKFQEGVCPTCGQEVADYSPEELEKTRRDLEEQLGELRQSREATYQKEKSSLESELAQLATRRQELAEAEEADLSEKIDKIQELLNTAITERQAFSAYEESAANLSGRKQMLEQQLEKSAPTPLEQVEVDNLRKLVADFDRLTISVAEHETTVRAQVSVVEQLESDLTEAREARKALGDSSEMPSEEEVAEAEAQTQLAAVKQLELRKTLQEVAALEVKIEQYHATIEQLNEQKEAQEQEAKWVRLCTRAREVLHVSGLPSLLIREYATVLNRRIRYYLSIWEAPFVMELDENLAFIAVFDDGKILPANRLSGGQRIVASTSFRLAMADTFARQVGLLILDEPSNHLDKDNIVHLQNLLVKLKELAGASGRQVIMVDHEESLVGFFDHVITLETIQESHS